MKQDKKSTLFETSSTSLKSHCHFDFIQIFFFQMKFGAFLLFWVLKLNSDSYLRCLDLISKSEANFFRFSFVAFLLRFAFSLWECLLVC